MKRAVAITIALLLLSACDEKKVASESDIQAACAKAHGQVLYALTKTGQWSAHLCVRIEDPK